MKFLSLGNLKLGFTSSQFIFIHVELQHASRGTATRKPWWLGATIQTGKQRSYSVCRDVHKENLQSQRNQGEKENTLDF